MTRIIRTPNAVFTFDSLDDATEHRRTRGCGGWIFAVEKTGEAILFPPHLTPSQVMLHPMARGLSGELK